MDLYSDLPPENESNSVDSNKYNNQIKITNNIEIKSTIKQIDKQIDKQTDKQLDKSIEKQTDSQNNINKTNKQSFSNPLQFKPRQTTTSAVVSHKINKQTNSSIVNRIVINNNYNSIDNETKAFEESISYSFEVDDPYDPFKPNDYLIYLDERKEEERLKQIEKENILLLMEQEQKRLEKEKERAMLIESGDITKLQQTIGRGRGRTVNNLPSWMTKLQSNESDSNNKLINQSTVILILNMINKNEIDNQIINETMNECSKYGKVNDCKIHLSNEWNEVRVFVSFDQLDSSIKALNDLNGRYFDGKQLVVRFYDVNDYNTSRYDS